MNEEEILKIMEELKESVRYKTIIPNEERNEWKREFDAIQGLLDLYYKQQKKIEKLQRNIQLIINEIGNEAKSYDYQNKITAGINKPTEIAYVTLMKLLEEINKKLGE